MHEGLSYVMLSPLRGKHETAYGDWDWRNSDLHTLAGVAAMFGSDEKKQDESLAIKENFYMVVFRKIKKNWTFNIFIVLTKRKSFPNHKACSFFSRGQLQRAHRPTPTHTHLVREVEKHFWEIRGSWTNNLVY